MNSYTKNHFLIRRLHQQTPLKGYSGRYATVIARLIKMTHYSKKTYQGQFVLEGVLDI